MVFCSCLIPHVRKIRLTAFKVPNSTNHLITVNLKLSVRANAEATASLCLGQCEKQFKESDTARVNLNNISYTVILQEVKPYPGKDRTSKKKAVLIEQKD